MSRCLWDSGRGKGRTLRMLNRAVIEMKRGLSVYVVVREAQIQPMMDRLAMLAPKAERRNDTEIFQGAGFIRIMTLPHESLRKFFQDGQFYGTSDGSVILIDHHVVETELGYALNQWLLWCGEEYDHEKALLGKDPFGFENDSPVDPWP